MFTEIATQRRAFAAACLSEGTEILEIGAFDNPTFRREAGEKVWYLDLFSKDDLARMHAGNRNRQRDRIVETDFVIETADFSSRIGRSFDLIVAHHVIEHVADPLLWFAQCGKLLRDGGRVFLSVPDRNFTFDFFRPVSLASQMVRAHEEGARKPQLWQVVDHFFYHQKVKVSEIWDGKPPTAFTPRFPLAEAIRMAKERENIYTDTHCWVFTPGSFLGVVEDLRNSNYIDFRLEALQETQRYSNEFRVMLRKG